MTAPGWPRPTRPVRVAVCISHPVSYFCALYAEVAADPRIDMSVLFGVRTGADPYDDAEFGTRVDPGLGPVLARFPHRFLSDASDLDEERRVPVARIMAALDEVDPDVVLIYGFNRRISRAGWWWAQRRGRRLAYLADSEDRGLRSTHPAVGIVKRVLAAAVLRGADLVLTVGDANEAFHRARGVPPERMVRVPFPIDLRAFAGADDGVSVSRLRARHDLGRGMIVLSSGKLVARKRHADLVAALARSSARADAVLVLLGDGDEREHLAAEAARSGVRLVVTGFVRPGEVVDWYRAADVYAHVSDFDPHPLAISEAVHTGLPVIVSDRVGSWGPTDDVVPEVNGLVVPTGDVRALTATLDRLLGDDALRAAMAAASLVRGAELQRAAYREFPARLAELGAVGPRRGRR